MPKGKPNHYIFGGNSCITSSEYCALWENYRKATSITCTPHQIRHAYVTLLYESGIDEFAAMKFVGHADISTMRNIYTHLREDEILKLAKQIEISI